MLEWTILSVGAHFMKIYHQHSRVWMWMWMPMKVVADFFSWMGRTRENKNETLYFHSFQTSLFIIINSENAPGSADTYLTE